MENTKSLSKLSATEIVKEVTAGRLSAVEIMQSCIDRVEEVEPEIHAWEYFSKEKAINQAQLIDEKIKRKENLGALCSVPVGIKDVFNTEDMPTCMGSPLWAGFTPGNDARAVTYIRWADGIIPGKTVTAEFAVHHPGPTVNPYNPEYSPGTSSSGSAAAVASFMVPLALGTQTAGSTIRPASYCGIYGFKPSFGLIPRTGILKTLDMLDHVTLLTRSVEDLYLLFNVLRVKGPNYPFVNKFMGNHLQVKQEYSSLWKVAFIKTPTWDQAEKYAQDSIIDYVETLSKHKNIMVEEEDLPEVFNLADDLHELIYIKALSYYFEDEYEYHKEKISRLFCEMVEKGKGISFQEYRSGIEKQNELIHQLDRLLDEYDIIITLSTAGEAPRGLHTLDKRDSCLIWTLCHTLAINLPLFKGPNNLPFGAQIISRRLKDYDLLDFARYLEKEGLFRDWKEV